MSTSQSNKSKNTSKFCKVCYDAGKEYTTHYVRDSIGGAVVCPTLLNQQCKYCKKEGHTPSHCPSLEGKYNKHKPVAEPAAKQTREVRFNQLRESPPPAKQAPAKQAPAPERKAPTPAKQAPAKQAPAKRAPPPANVPAAKKIKNSGKNYFNSLSDIMEEEAIPLAVGANPLAVGSKKTEPSVDELKREAALNDNFPVLSLRPNQLESGKIIRPMPNKLNGWATVAAQAAQTQAQPVQQAQPIQAQPIQAQAQQAEDPDSDSDSEDESKVELKTYSGSWADME
jgi:hypothetical protein